jgi:hypothetical protein
MSEHSEPIPLPKAVTWGQARAMDGDYLCAADLQGKDVLVTIEDVRIVETIDSKGKPDHKNLIFLAGKKKAWESNTTNDLCLEKMFGTDVKNAIGKRVVIHSEEVDAFGEIKPAIRVVGSPDIERGFSFSVTLGKKGRQKTISRTIVKTEAGRAANTATAVDEGGAA